MEPFGGPGGEEGWALLRSLRDPRVVARSRTTLTEAGFLDLPGGPVPVHRKVYAYRGAAAALAGLFRTTFAARSRSAREADALLLLHPLGLAPAPVAVAERRTLGLLREAMVASRTVEGGRDLEARDAEPGLAEAAGRAAGRMHAAGLGDLSLAPRNLVAAPAGPGAWEVRKVDSGGMRRAARGGALQAADLADLLAGLEGRWPQEGLDALRAAYAREAGGLPAGLGAAMEGARARRARRSPTRSA
jgi:hypothetical protein